MMWKIEKISATYSILASVITTITLSVILLTQPVTVNAAEQTALGYEIDFFPTAISATAGEAGFAFQTWAGIDHLKIRLIGAHITLPDKLVKNENFRNRKIDVNAIIVDYVFGQHFDGWWIGTGFEIWQNSIEYAPNGTTAEWTTSVLTAGGGYIFRFYDNLYINPWGALHYVLNAREIRQDVDTYKENAFQYSASLKIGYFFDM